MSSGSEKKRKKSWRKMFGKKRRNEVSIRIQEEIAFAQEEIKIGKKNMEVIKENINTTLDEGNIVKAQVHITELSILTAGEIVHTHNIKRMRELIRWVHEGDKVLAEKELAADGSFRDKPGRAPK